MEQEQEVVETASLALEERSTLESLLERLRLDNKDTVREAFQEARALPPDQLLELFKRIEQITLPRPKRNANISTRSIVLLIAGLLLAGYGLDPHSTWLLRLCLLPSGGFLLALGIYSLVREGTQILTLPPERVAPRFPTFQLMEGIEDPRFLGYMLNLMAESSLEFREEEPPLRLAPVSLMGARLSSLTDIPSFRALRTKTLNFFTNGLNQMLAKAAPEQLAALTRSQRIALLLPLNIPSYDVELTLRILKALEQIGDNDSWPVVERLAHREFYLFGTDEAPSPEREQVREAARRCLPHIQRNLKEAMQAAALLRPSASDAVPATLLRPASPASDVAASELLRPTNESSVSS